MGWEHHGKRTCHVHALVHVHVPSSPERGRQTSGKVIAMWVRLPQGRWELKAAPGTVSGIGTAVDSYHISILAGAVLARTAVVVVAVVVDSSSAQN